MTEENKDIFYELLIKKAASGLDEAEQSQLDEFDAETVEFEFRAIEAAAAAINLAGISEIEPLPASLRSRIIADSADHLVALRVPAAESNVVPENLDERPLFEAADGGNARPGSWFGWLGWAAAAAASIALVVNISLTRLQTVETAKDTKPVEVAVPLTPFELRDEMLRQPTAVITAKFAAGNVSELKGIAGDVVWSDDKQAGYMRFRGLPVNDVSQETYQLWIFDETQDSATPIDGGVFDVSTEGEVIIPINAKLKTKRPQMFAVTIEKPGGVVVSKREKIAALAKVETRSS